MGKGNKPIQGVNWQAFRKGRSKAECRREGCERLKQRGSEWCSEHNKQEGQYVHECKHMKLKEWIDGLPRGCSACDTENHNIIVRAMNKQESK